MHLKHLLHPIEVSAQLIEFLVFSVQIHQLLGHSCLAGEKLDDLRQDESFVDVGLVSEMLQKIAEFWYTFLISDFNNLVETYIFEYISSFVESPLVRGVMGLIK